MLLCTNYIVLFALLYAGSFIVEKQENYRVIFLENVLAFLRF